LVPVRVDAPAAVVEPDCGDDLVRVCEIFCHAVWSTSGRFVYVSQEEPSRVGAGRSLAIPVGPGETLPVFPPLGIPPQVEPTVMPGARPVAAALLMPGADPDTYVYPRGSRHQNLFRIVLRGPVIGCEPAMALPAAPGVSIPRTNSARC
jgi:hypothetical protein